MFFVCFGREEGGGRVIMVATVTDIFGLVVAVEVGGNFCGIVFFGYPNGRRPIVMIAFGSGSQRPMPRSTPLRQVHLCTSILWGSRRLPTTAPAAGIISCQRDDTFITPHHFTPLHWNSILPLVQDKTRHDKTRQDNNPQQSTISSSRLILRPRRRSRKSKGRIQRTKI